VNQRISLFKKIIKNLGIQEFKNSTFENLNALKIEECGA